MTQTTDVALRLAGNNYPVPAIILNALPQWWQELSAAMHLVREEGVAYLAVPYGVDDRVMCCDDQEDSPSGWWGRFRITQRTGEVLELADALTGSRYNITVLGMFLEGLIAPDPFDSLEVLQMTQDLHMHIYGCIWEAMPAFGKVS